MPYHRSLKECALTESFLKGVVLASRIKIKVMRFCTGTDLDNILVKSDGQGHRLKVKGTL